MPDLSAFPGGKLPEWTDQDEAMFVDTMAKVLWILGEPDPKQPHEAAPVER